MPDDNVPTRTYRTSEVSPEQLALAVAEQRVLFVCGGSRAYGSGDVWFNIGQTGDLDGRPPEGIILAEPVTVESLQTWNEGPWDSAWEYWEAHDSSELTWPCRRMTPEQRVRFKQAVAMLLVDILETLPYVIDAEDVAYIELLHLYALDPRPELAQKVVSCARACGWDRVVFDPEQKWEKDGEITAADPLLRKDLPRALAEAVFADCRVATRDINDMSFAQNWLVKWMRCWVTESAWEIGQGVKRNTPSIRDMTIPAVFLQYSAPSRFELEQRLQGLLSELDGKQPVYFRRHCICQIAGRLRQLPDIPSGLETRLKAVERHHQHEVPSPEFVARADSLAAEATRIGMQALFGEPFRWIKVTDPVEIANRWREAQREMAALSFRALTRGLAVRSDAEQEAIAHGESALMERLCRVLRTLMRKA